jgi:helicase MOV-10
MELEQRFGKNEIMVGSTEQFQGQERDAIILSTVRSYTVAKEGHGGGLGFLTNPKRFNVAITRAKSMLVVVGDPYLLQRDKRWRALIKHAVDNGKL